MIQSFIESWPLFAWSYVAGWGLAALLAGVGVVVVARDQIFLGAAVAQASVLGIALSVWVERCFELLGRHEHHGEPVAGAMAVLFSALAALVTSGAAPRQDSHEAITGWVFLFCSSVAILLVSHSPLGLDEVHRLLSSSLIGASAFDGVLYVVLALATLALALRVRDRLVLLISDPLMAEVLGLRVRAWNVGLALVLGLVVGLAIRTSGLLYTFGCLVLPALLAKQICREVRPLFWVAPLLALGFAGAGFVVANHFDFPPAQMTVALLAAAWPLGRLRRAHASRAA